MKLLKLMATTALVAACVAFTTPVHTILDLSTKYQGSDRTIPAGSDIEGIVISDLSNLNITANNVVIQDATGGIVVRFNTANPYTLGQKVHFNISNQTLTSYNGLVEVLGVDGSTGLDISLSTVTGTGTITPRIATLQDIVTNKDLWESTLVQISGVTISGAGTYSGNTTLTDATGTLPMYTRTSSTFSAIAYPTTPVTITGIVSDFNAAQLNIRNANDVQP